MQRIVVVGVTGSGKTSLAKQIARCRAIPHIELDRLHWLPGWQNRSPEDFRACVAEAISGTSWVADGNYSAVRDLLWSRADTVVWLDYPLLLVLWRLLNRTISRICTQEDLWGTGNRESWRKQFFSRESLFLWALQTYGRRRKTYSRLAQHPAYAHLMVVRLHSPRETAAWLGQLC